MRRRTSGATRLVVGKKEEGRELRVEIVRMGEDVGVEE
jgi:hypothetical protein